MFLQAEGTLAFPAAAASVHHRPPDCLVVATHTASTTCGWSASFAQWSERGASHHNHGGCRTDKLNFSTADHTPLLLTDHLQPSPTHCFSHQPCFAVSLRSRDLIFIL